MGRRLFNSHWFEDVGRERATGGQRLLAPGASGNRENSFNVLSVLYCAALSLFAPFAATVSLILWLHCRVGQRTVSCVIMSLMVSYLYLIYAFVWRDLASAWLELSLLAALNGIALRSRLSHEALAGALSLRNAALEKLATIDELTAMYCRRHICELGRKEFSRSCRSGEPLGVLLLDVDQFKEINDGYGHAAGDKTLVDISAIMRNNLRSQDLLGRYGGDEFLVLLPNTGPSGAEMTADRLRRAICSHLVVHGSRRIALTISMGISIFDLQAEDFQNLVDRADVALYDAKSQGGNRFHFWSDLDDRRKTLNDVGEMNA